MPEDVEADTMDDDDAGKDSIRDEVVDEDVSEVKTQGVIFASDLSKFLSPMHSETHR